MRRRRLVNGILLGLALGIGATLWMLPADDGDDGTRLTGLDPAALRALTLEYPRAEARAARPELHLERRNDGWHLTRPIERTARDGRIVTALGVLSARTRSCYDLADHDPADFGLAPPRLRLRVDDTTLAFGNRSEDGRRYVSTGSRLCLVADRTHPLLAQGLGGLAVAQLLPAGATPMRIETPGALAARSDQRAEWQLERSDRGQADLTAWAAGWQAAAAQSFELAPADADHGRIRIDTADGGVHRWRIAQSEPGLVLVPEDAGYGLRIASEDAADLLHPPAATDTQSAPTEPR